MFGEYVGIDIGEDSVAAVKVKHGLRENQVMACASVEIEQAGGRNEALGLLRGMIDVEDAVCNSIVPDDRLSYRNISMPFSDRKKVGQTLPFELETIMASPIEEFIIDFSVVNGQPDKTDVLSAAVRRSYLSEHLALLQAHGIEPEVLDVGNVPTVTSLLGNPDTPDNGLHLHIGYSKCSFILFLKRRIVLIRKVSFDGSILKEAIRKIEGEQLPDEKDVTAISVSLQALCKTIQNTLMAFVDQTDRTLRLEKVFLAGKSSLYPEMTDMIGNLLEVPVVTMDLHRITGVGMDSDVRNSWRPELMNNALALALREKRQDAGFNFRVGEFAYRKQLFKFQKEMRSAGIFLCVIVLMLIADAAVDYYSLSSRYKTLDSKLEAIFTETFPDVKRIVDPVQQMRSKVNELKEGAGSLQGVKSNQKVLDLIGEISARIPQSYDVVVTNLVVDQEGVQLKGTADTFNTVDNIMKGLEESALLEGVTISSANLDRSGKQVIFEIRSKRLL